MFKDMNGNNTPNDPVQDMYNLSDDDTKRSYWRNHFKFPKFKDRRSIFCNAKAEPMSTRHNRNSFADCVDRFMSNSLKVIEPQKEWFPTSKKKPSQIDKIRMGILDDERRFKRSRTLDKPDKNDKMLDVVEALDDTEQDSESEKDEKEYSKLGSSFESPKLYPRSDGQEFSEDLLKNDSGLMRTEPLDLANLEKALEKRPSIEKKRDSLEKKRPSILKNRERMKSADQEETKEDKTPQKEESGLRENLHLLGLFALDQVKEKPCQISEVKENNENDILRKKPVPPFIGSSSSIENKCFAGGSSNNPAELSVSQSSLADKIMQNSQAQSKDNKTNLGSGSSIENNFIQQKLKDRNVIQQVKKSPKNSEVSKKESTPKRDANDLSIKTDSSSDELSSQHNTTSNQGKKMNSNITTQNSIVSFKYVRNLQRKSVSIVSGFFPKLGKRDSVSISKKDMNDMGVNLEIVRLSNNIKVNKNRVNYADVLKGLMELFIRNACVCDASSLRSTLKLISFLPNKTFKTLIRGQESAGRNISETGEIKEKSPSFS